MTELFTQLAIPLRTWDETIMMGATEGNPQGADQASGGLYIGGRYVGGTMEGVSYRSTVTGARFEILPEADLTIGCVAYDDAGTVVFKVLVSGTDKGDVIIGNYAGGQGAMWDDSAGTFVISGALNASSINIPDTVTANSFHVDSDGNTWWGATVIGSATAKVLKTGAATFTSMVLTGLQAGSSIDGTYLASASVTGTAIGNATITATNIANATITATQIANSTITASQISGTAGITGSQIASGTITAANIGALTITAAEIANLTIVAANIANATITGAKVVQNTITGGATGNLALGTITADNIVNATITATQIANATITTTQISGTAAIVGTQLANSTITATQIAALTITASEIANLTITSGKINDVSIDKLTTGTITSKTMTLAVAAGTGNSYIAAGKTTFDNTVSGFILGIDDAVAGDPAKFYIGSTTIYMNWTGVALNINGAALTAGTIQTSASGQRVRIVGSATTTPTQAANSIMLIDSAGDEVASLGSQAAIVMAIYPRSDQSGLYVNSAIVASTNAVVAFSSGHVDSTGQTVLITNNSLASLTLDIQLNNADSDQPVVKITNAGDAGDIQMTNLGANPTSGVVGQICVVSGVLKICTSIAPLTWTIVGSQS